MRKRVRGCQKLSQEIPAYSRFRKASDPTQEIIHFQPVQFGYEIRRAKRGDFAGSPIRKGAGDDFSGEDTIFFDCEPLQVGARSFSRLSVKNYAYDKSFAPGGKAVLQANLLQSDEDPTFSIYSDQTVPIGEIVQVMNIAKRNHYKVILATSPE